jgi:SMC interacting uncharacterized protein involved in chromosome segregation
VVHFLFSAPANVRSESVPSFHPIWFNLQGLIYPHLVQKRRSLDPPINENPKELFMSESKNEYVVRQTGNIKSWADELVKYQARADRASENKVDKLNRHIAELKEKRTGLENKVSEIQKAGETGWEELKTSADKSFKELDKLFKSTQPLFN